MQHLDKTLATYVWKDMQDLNKHTCNIRMRKQMKHWNRIMQHTCTTIATYAASWSTFATSISSNCNKPIKHLKHRLVTCSFSTTSPYCLACRHVGFTGIELAALVDKVVAGLVEKAVVGPRTREGRGELEAKWRGRKTGCRAWTRHSGDAVRLSGDCDREGCTVTPIYRPNGMHTLMCAQRSITHKFTNFNRSIITNVITSRYLNT
jgi:hypothetical protein